MDVNKKKKTEKSGCILKYSLWETNLHISFSNKSIITIFIIIIIIASILIDYGSKVNKYPVGVYWEKNSMRPHLVMNQHLLVIFVYVHQRYNTYWYVETETLCHRPRK